MIQAKNEEKLLSDEEEKIAQDTAELTSVKEQVLLIEDRLACTLSNQIKELIRPLKQSKIEYLEEELRIANYILMELQSTFLGMWVLRGVNRRIKKESEVKDTKSKKGEEHVKTQLPKDAFNLMAKGNNDA